MNRRLLLPVLVAALGLPLSGCGPIPNTGLQITVTPPDQTQFLAGTQYDTLYVDVQADNTEESTTIPIDATTPSPYTVVVLMNGVVHRQAQQVTVALRKGSMVLMSQIFPNEPVSQDKLTPIPVDFSMQGT